MAEGMSKIRYRDALRAFRAEGTDYTALDPSRRNATIPMWRGRNLSFYFEPKLLADAYRPKADLPVIAGSFS
jgi:hypothetical protein